MAAVSLDGRRRARELEMKLEAQLDGNISLGVTSIGIGATAGDLRGFMYHAEKRCRTAAILHFFFPECVAKGSRL